jgi:N-acetyltransferase 10
MASTVNGYEGTGRSLSLKLIQQLREQASGYKADSKSDASADRSHLQGQNSGGRILKELKLEEPIRYGENDPSEKWLNKLLCLDATTVSNVSHGCPHPKSCELYYINRDTLFSYHPASEAFLQRLMALYVSSHYKNTPNDLQMMSDAPSHHLFVLLPPITDDCTLPEPLVFLQVALEGEISKETVLSSLSRGKRADGDLIPWTVTQQFQDDDFALFSGARVVRIATHPDYAGMGYGSRSLQLLTQYYQGEIQSLDEDIVAVDQPADKDLSLGSLDDSVLHSETITIRDPNRMPPLFLKLSERRPEILNWVGVSYGLTAQLLKFWKRSGFYPVYLRQTPNDLTGENTCIMMKQLASDAKFENWLGSFEEDFKRRFVSLLSYEFRKFTPSVALNILDAGNTVAELSQGKP